MNLTIEEIGPGSLAEFLREVPHTPFLQSLSWGSFQEKIGNKSYQAGIFDSDKLIGVCSAYQVKSKFASYLYIPAGPVFKKWNKEVVGELTRYLFKIAKEQSLDFVRLEPRVIAEDEASLLINSGFRKTRLFTQPECTAIIDLSKSEEELLSAMNDSTRYNVRMVERRGVKVRIGGLEDLKIFETLLAETAKRHHFTQDAHSAYYRKQYETLNKEGLMEIFVAEFDKQPLAASLVIFYGDTATYLHAASTTSQSKMRASYLLVWKTILEGKRRGFKYFDFWGVAPEGSSQNHPWAGVTAFKISFGGERVSYEPVFDYPTSNQYILAKFVEVIRKPVRKILRML